MKTLAGRFVLTAIAAAIATAPQAAEVVWLGLNNDWNDGPSWVDGLAPASGDAVRVTDEVNASVTTLNVGSFANGPTFASVVVDGLNNTVTLVHDLGFSLNTDRLTIGDAGSGSFEMVGGELNVLTNDINVNAFIVGNQSGSVARSRRPEAPSLRRASCCRQRLRLHGHLPPEDRSGRRHHRAQFAR